MNIRHLVMSCIIICFSSYTWAAENNEKLDLTELSKKASDPLAKLISVPIFGSVYTDAGNTGKTNRAMNIQPIIPVEVNGNVMINRLIIPILDSSVPQNETGLGDITYTSVFTKDVAGHWKLGLGPFLSFPTADDDSLGSNKWAAGLSTGAVRRSKDSPWVVGGLLQHLWDVGGSGVKDANGDVKDVDRTILQPLITYNVRSHPGLSFTFQPIMSADWEADSGDRFVLPVGGGVTKLFRLGKVPTAVSSQFYQNLGDSEAYKYEYRFFIRFLFPK